MERRPSSCKVHTAPCTAKGAIAQSVVLSVAGNYTISFYLAKSIYGYNVPRPITFSVDGNAVVAPLRQAPRLTPNTRKPLPLAVPAVTYRLRAL